LEARFQGEGVIPLPIYIYDVANISVFRDSVLLMW